MDFNVNKFNNEQLKAFARINAHLCGDGCISCYETGEKDRKNRIEIGYINTNNKLLKEFREDMETCFGVRMVHYPKQVRVTVKSIRIGRILLSLGSYKTREWRVPAFVQNSSTEIKLEWIKAFCHDEGYVPEGKTIIRIKSMNEKGLFDMQELLQGMNIDAWITGKNCDDSWYLNVRKMGLLAQFEKEPCRKKIAGKGFEPSTCGL